MRNKLYREKLKDLKVIERFAEVLSNVDEIKRTYLTTDWAETVELYEKNVQEVEKVEKEIVENKKGFSSTSETNVEENIEKVTKEDLLRAKFEQEIQLKKDIKIKLVISEISHTSARKNLRTFLSPILTTFDQAPTFGMFHSSLQIGPCKLKSF